MKGWRLIWLLCMSVSGCFPSDGSPAAPFYVDFASVVTPATGSSCAPFPSLAEALTASSSLSTATIALESAASLPAFSVTNSLQILANSHSIALSGTLVVTGNLEIADAALTSSALTGHSFDVSGGILSLSYCEVSGFSGFLVLLRGEVVVSNCVFRNNAQGVFASSRLGGILTLANSQFYSNAATSGAVFFIYPSGGNEATTISVTNCTFESNGAAGGSSVLALNDLGTGQSTETQTVFFSKSSFKGNFAAPFQVTSKAFNITIEGCTFENEPQIVTGSLTTANLTLSSSSIVNSAGPLVSLTMSGQLCLNSTNFTNINPGPVVYVIGRSPATSLVLLNQLILNFINNPGVVVLGTLINSVSTTMWLTDVSLSNFTAQLQAIMFISQSILYSQRLSFYNGTATVSVIGSFVASTAVMNDTLFDWVNSRGSMSFLTASNVEINQVTFRNIIGFWDVNIFVYTTNFMIINPGSMVTLNGLIGELAIPGSTIIYIAGGKCIMSNSHFVGPLGMGLITVLGGSVTVRTSTFRFTMGRAYVKLLLGGYFDIDTLELQDLTLSSPIITISSLSTAYIKSLILTNVTSIALGKGQDYRLRVDSARILRSSVSSLAHFSISA